MTENETTTATAALDALANDSDVDPMSFQSHAKRSQITLAYWAVILLCIPYWWYSTAIERHSLPLSAVSAWNSVDVRGNTVSCCKAIKLIAAHFYQPCPVLLPISLQVEGLDNTPALITKLNEEASQAKSCLVFRDATRSTCRLDCKS